MLRRAAFSPNIKERADCSAALFTADGDAARPGRAHPGAPRVDAGVGGRRRIDALGADARARASRWSQRPVRRRHPPQRHHPRRPVPSSTARLVGWVANRAHHADLGGAAPGRSPPTPPRSSRRACASRRCASPPRCAAMLLAVVAHARRAARRPRRPGRRQPSSASSAAWPSWPTQPLDEVVAYGERRMRAALAALPDGDVDASSDVLDSHRLRRRPAARRPRIRRHGHRRRRRRSPSTSPAPTRRRRATSTPSRP